MTAKDEPAWTHHDPYNTDPRLAYEALLAIDELVSKQDGVEPGDVFEVLQNKNKFAAILGSDVEDRDEGPIQKLREIGLDPDDEVLQEMLRRYEKAHIYYLIDKGFLYDHGKVDGKRKLELSGPGHSVVEADQQGKKGRARRLFVEALENTQAHTFRHGAYNRNKSGPKGVRPLSMIAEIVDKRGELNLYELAEHLFDHHDADNVIDALENEERSYKQLADVHEYDPDLEQSGEKRINFAVTLVRHARSHPAFYVTGSAERRTIRPRNKAALKQLTEKDTGLDPQLHKGFRKPPRKVQQTSGLRVANLTSLEQVGPKKARTFYRTLANELEENDTDEALSEAVTTLPDPVQDEARERLTARPDYAERFRGELELLHESTQKLLADAPDQHDLVEQVLSVVGFNGVDRQDVITYLTGETDEPPRPEQPQKAYEALLGLESFGRALYYEKIRRGLNDDVIQNALKQLHEQYTTGEEPEVEPIDMISAELLNEHERDERPALKLENAFGLSLISMANEDRGVTETIRRNLLIEDTPVGPQATHYAPGKTPDVSVLIDEVSTYILAEVTGLSDDKDLMEREFPAIIDHAERFADEQDVPEEELIIYFVTALSLNEESMTWRKAFQTHHEYGPSIVPNDIEGHADLFAHFKQLDGHSLDQFETFLRGISFSAENHDILRDAPNTIEWLNQTVDEAYRQVNDGEVEDIREIDVTISTRHEGEGVDWPLVADGRTLQDIVDKLNKFDELMGTGNQPFELKDDLEWGEAVDELYDQIKDFYYGVSDLLGHEKRDLQSIKEGLKLPFVMGELRELREEWYEQTNERTLQELVKHVGRVLQEHGVDCDSEDTEQTIHERYINRLHAIPGALLQEDIIKPADLADVSQKINKLGTLAEKEEFVEQSKTRLEQEGGCTCEEKNIVEE